MLRSFPAPVDNNNGKWDDTQVCPEVAKWKCGADNDFECPRGYYPVCGDVPGQGFKRLNNVTYQDCADACNDNSTC